MFSYMVENMNHTQNGVIYHKLSFSEPYSALYCRKLNLYRPQWQKSWYECQFLCLESSHVGDLSRKSCVSVRVCGWWQPIYSGHVSASWLVDDVTYSSLWKRLKYEEECFIQGEAWMCISWVDLLCSMSNRAVMWAEEQCWPICSALLRRDDFQQGGKERWLCVSNNIPTHSK